MQPFPHPSTPDHTGAPSAALGPCAEVLPIERQPAAVYLARLAPGSRRTMAGALDTLAGMLLPGMDLAACPWWLIRYQHAQAIRAQLAARYAPATANKHLAALRGVLAESWRLGLMNAEDYRRAADVAPVRGRRQPTGRALDAGERSALLAACEDGTVAGSRDRALLAVVYAAGLRRSEAVALRLADWQPREVALAVRHGKGNKARTCYLAEGAAAALVRWLAVRGDWAGPLFVRVRAGDQVTREALSAQGLLHVLTRRAGLAGIARVSPHDLRRSMISDLLDAGADISTVQQLAGHAQVTTTQRYDRRGEATKRRVARLLQVR